MPCCCIVYLSATVHIRCLSAAYGNAKQVPDSIMCGHETWSMYSNWIATKSESGRERIVSEGVRNVRSCRLSYSSRSSWLKKISSLSPSLTLSLCSHRLWQSVVDHLHNTHFQWVIAIHDWAHYLRHTITSTRSINELKQCPLRMLLSPLETRNC